MQGNWDRQRLCSASGARQQKCGTNNGAKGMAGPTRHRAPLAPAVQEAKEKHPLAQMVLCLGHAMGTSTGHFSQVLSWAALGHALKCKSPQRPAARPSENAHMLRTAHTTCLSKAESKLFDAIRNCSPPMLGSAGSAKITKAKLLTDPAALLRGLPLQS